MRRARLLVAVLGIALVVTACASVRRTGGTESATTSTAPSTTTSPSPSSRPRDEATVAGTQARLAGAGTRSFTFAAAGDLGANPTTAEGLRRLDDSPAEFFLALGDLDYDETSSDAAWCDYVHEHLPQKGADFPFEVVSGNHEADDGQDGRVSNHAACLRDRLDAHGKYGAQYFVDYPRRKPYARILMLSPNLTVDGHTYRYGRGTADRRWLVRRINAAREAGIRWIVVGMHYPCLSTGAAHRGCDSGAAVYNLLLRKRVDLLLNGHNHIYERSKQIRLSRKCRRVRPGRFDADCVVDGGGDGVYRRGRGLVQVTSGRVGGRHQGVNRRDPDRRWFVKAGGGTTGITRVTVTPTRMKVRYLPTGGRLRDAFVIR